MGGLMCQSMTWTRLDRQRWNFEALSSEPENSAPSN